MKSIVLLILTTLTLTTCKVYSGNDGTGFFTIIDNERWLYGNSSSVYWFDDTRQFDLEKVRALPESAWIHSKHNTTFGILEAILWVRLDIKSKSEAEDWILYIESPFLPKLEFFVEDPITGKFTSKIAGRRISMEQMTVPNKNPVFSFRITKDKPVRMYLRVETAGPALIPLRFFTANKFDIFSRLTDFVSGAYYGAMLLLLLYNIVLFISIRDKLFIFYCVYIFSFVLFIFNANNQWLPFIDFSDSIFVITLGPITSLISTIAATGFAWVFLFPNKDKTWVKKALKLTIVLDVLALLSLGFLNLMEQVKIANVVPVLGVIVICIAAVIRFRQGYNGARYFLIAWSFLIVSVLLYVLMNLGFIDYSNFISYSPMYGSFFEGVFLSLGIGDRINSLKREREEARKALLESQRKSLEEEKRINQSISRFVPNQFLEILKRKTILEVYRGDSVEQNLTILFSDIRNFTNLSESKPAKEVFLLLNEYMEKLGPAIAGNNGFIDKYIGDAIMALFSGSPKDAIFAALAMREKIRGMRDTTFKDFHLDAGFGIHYGSVMLGTVGEANRLDTTVIGDNVNLASRLESLTKNYGIPIIASDTVCRNIPEDSGLEFREIDSVIVKGKTVPIVIYEVLNADTEEVMALKKESFPHFFTGLHEYKSRNFNGALECFELCLEICPSDSVAQTYKQRANSFSIQPPPPEWTGLLKF
jgi:adenylate cyclase